MAQIRFKQTIRLQSGCSNLDFVDNDDAVNLIEKGAEIKTMQVKRIDL